jgi:hypothetical protein
VRAADDDLALGARRVGEHVLNGRVSMMTVPALMALPPLVVLSGSGCVAVDVVAFVLYL